LYSIKSERLLMISHAYFASDFPTDFSFFSC